MASERVRTRTARSGVKDTNSHMRPPLLDKKTANRPFPIVKSNGYNIFISFLSFESWVFCYFTTGQQLPCGSTPISQSRVIGGQDAKPGAWPWQVRITVQLAQQFNKRTSTDVTRFDSRFALPYLKVICLSPSSIAPSGSAVKEWFYNVHIKYYVIVSWPLYLANKILDLKVTNDLRVLKKAELIKPVNGSRYKKS